LGAIASAGVLETAYLTYAHVTASNVLFCSSDAADDTCQSVLMGPYSVVPGTENLPLATLGLVAYTVVAVLALGPTFNRDRDNNDDDDTSNRIALVAVTTAMGVFSAGLLTILFGVLHTSCVYCITSAILSLSLAKLSWLGGVAPKDRLPSTILSSLATSVAAVALAGAVFWNVEPATALSSPSSATSLAAATSQPSQQQQQQQQQPLEGPYSPPPITTTSSPEALQVARLLQQLDTHFYGAYWCSHCYDQKQTLGKEAMQLIPYIECSKEGRNAQTTLCRDKHIPGYPTWEVAGTLYPGEQALEELQDIIVKELAAHTNR